jgi:hypothetical protein
MHGLNQFCRLPTFTDNLSSFEGRRGSLTILTVYDRVLNFTEVTDGSFVDCGSFEDVESECQSLSMIEVVV